MKTPYKIVTVMMVSVVLALGCSGPSPEETCKALGSVHNRCEGEGLPKYTEEMGKGCVEFFTKLAKKDPKEAKSTSKVLLKCNEMDCKLAVKCVAIMTHSLGKKASD